METKVFIKVNNEDIKVSPLAFGTAFSAVESILHFIPPEEYLIGGNVEKTNHIILETLANYYSFRDYLRTINKINYKIDHLYTNLNDDKSTCIIHIWLNRM